MQINAGDLVRTDSGLSGRVIHVSRLTAFVELDLEGGKEVVPILLSELIRIDPPQPPGGPTARNPVASDEPKQENN
jgi:hypothetical protein